jgi:hypothetical protein
VHLFRRDLHRAWATEPDKSDYERRVHMTVALRENALLERHFTETLARSSHVLRRDEIAALRAHALPESELPAREVDSRVSLDLITAIGERQIMAVLASLIVGLWLVQRRVRDAERPEASETR